MNERPTPGRPKRLSEMLTGTDIAFLANRLASYFLPTGAASLFTPGTQSQTLQDAATIALASGVLNWSFKTAFTVPPAVTATPEGTGSATLYVDSVTKTGCVVKSTAGGDTRTVHLQAVQPSQGD